MFQHPHLQLHVFHQSSYIRSTLSLATSPLSPRESPLQLLLRFTLSIPIFLQPQAAHRGNGRNSLHSLFPMTTMTLPSSEISTLITRPDTHKEWATRQALEAWVLWAFSVAVIWILTEKYYPHRVQIRALALPWTSA